MIRNYLIIAWRVLSRQFSFSLINIVGLAMGMACSLVITLFVYNEMQYDRHYPDGERIYRVATSFFNLGTFANGPQHLNERLKTNPEVEETTRIRRLDELVIATNDRQFIEGDVYAVDSGYFKMFQSPFLYGSKETCLNDLSAIVLGESIAKKFFGTTDVVGKTLLVGKDQQPKLISGVVKDTDQPSHLTGRIWMRFQSDRPNDGNYFSAHVYNYIKLKEGFSQEKLEQRIADLIKAEVYPVLNDGLSYDEWVKTPNAYKLYVQKLHDIYMYSKFRHEISAGGNIDNVYIFSGVAFLILFLATVNFINLATARAGKRAKEVGLRKTMGTSRSALIGQFLTESVITCLMAFALSILLAEVFLLAYQVVIGQPLLNGVLTNSIGLLVAFVFAILLGLIAGIYPAFYITSFQPSKVLKGSIHQGSRSVFRNALVVFQFVISSSLIAFILITLQQLYYLQNKDMGFDEENILVINNARLLDANRMSFKETLSRQPQVKSACFTSNAPGGNSFFIYTYKTKEMADRVTLNTMPGDEHMLETFGIRLLEGRNFDPRIDTDSTAAIINESVVRDLMLENPIGTELNTGLKVIGVVSDFHFKGLQNKIEPLVLKYQPVGYSLAFKLQGNVPDFISVVESEWKKLSPDDALSYSFIDDNFERLLSKERGFTRIIGFFSGMAILISCMGLFGLSLYTTEQRMKEIGIRKVLGASAQSILVLLNKGFTRLILWAIVLAVPLTFYFSNLWLANFAYHIEPNWQVYTLSTLLVLLLTWFTVGGSSWKAAARNPVDTLKYE